MMMKKKVKSVLELGSVIKVEASFALDRIITQLETLSPNLLKRFETELLLKDGRTVARLLRQSAIGVTNLEGVRVLALKRIAPVRRDDEEGLRSHSIKT